MERPRMLDLTRYRCSSRGKTWHLGGPCLVRVERADGVVVDTPMPAGWFTIDRLGVIGAGGS